MNQPHALAAALLAACTITTPAVLADEPTVNVTLDTYVRAESDHMIQSVIASFGGDIMEMTHTRTPVTADNNPVIRMNQDTFYSGTVLDLSQPVEVIMPDIGDRYMSMHIVNQDHYMFAEHESGSYILTEELVGTRFALIAFRTFVDANDPDDIALVHRIQDSIVVKGGGEGPYDAPNWDLDDIRKARQALNSLSELGWSSHYAFGSKEEVRAIDHLIGTGAGWAGLPRTAALYQLGTVDANDGVTAHTFTVKDVPVDAFWSITVYNQEGFLEANELGRNSYNNVTAAANEDGSITLNFGGCDDGRVNCIPITEGWNYNIRAYQPQQSILDGSWTFPDIKPVSGQ
ncbi:DUF1214 domain-containing protein [Motilimonas pumila]|uniref:DUF1214 domain-containing protein n=1 Tax=Motilimonas pumila TaxID=2303987 RepID=A0A418YDQ4_9GAMM|nr:DUF1214 domain-containing protein [Motilimonas pumila]RJG42673.1 DUF1214 domain-containing protein [Motilimonas pumila]